MKRILLLLLITSIIGIPVSLAQTTISGMVKDKSDNTPLEQVGIRLLSVKDSTLIAGATTNRNGYFTLSQIKPGNYIIAFTYIGYNTYYKNVSANSQSTKRNIGIIYMSPSDVMLKEAIVTGKKAEVIVKEDTVEFNADSYKTQPNAVVEDLMKKLPGIEIDNDGKITANGKEVTKILVDGKEFFANDTKVATKNLPADIVDKLQVVDRKSDLARLTGVDDGEDETVINLSIKKGMKQGWFGNAEAGYGTDNRYVVNAMVNRFIGDNQITILGSSNNTNNMGFTDGGGMQGRRGNWGMSGVNTSHNIGTNFNVGKEEIFRIGGDIMFSATNQIDRRRTQRQDLFKDSTSYKNSESYSNNKSRNLTANFRMKWEIDSMNVIEFRPNFQYNHSQSHQNDTSLTRAGDADRTPVNRSLNNENNKGHGYNLSGRLSYNHKFKSKLGRSFSLDFQYSYSDTREEGYSQSENWLYLLNKDSVLNQDIEDHIWKNSYSARLSYTEPIGKGHFLTFSYRFQQTFNNADKLAYNADSLDLFLIRDYSNSFRNDFTTHSFQIGFKTVRPNYTYNIGITADPSTSKSENLIDKDKTIPSYTVFNMAPFFYYRYKLDKRTNIRIDYRGRTAQPSMTQLQPVISATDAMHQTIGNPDLKPSYTNNLRLRFNNYNEEKQRSLMAMLFGNYTFNSIINYSTYNQTTGGQTTSYKNVNGVWNVFGVFMYSAPLRNKKWQLNSVTHIRYANDIGYNNGERNRAISFNPRENFGITYRNDWAEAGIRANYGYQLTSSSIQKNNNKEIHSYGGTFNGNIYLPFGLSIGTDLNYQGTKGYSNGYDENYWIWNAQISYMFLKNKNATVSLKVYDILQQRSNIRRTVTGNYIQDVEYNTINSYGLITFAYRFNAFGKGGNRNNGNRPGGPMDNPRRGGFGGGHPGPPPGGRF